MKNVSIITFFLIFVSFSAYSQQAYFVDGYHGGIFGHYPYWKTQFLVDKLAEYPDWRIGLEIETDTWDSVKLHTPDAYENFKKIVYDKRVDFTNPTVAQPYCYNISGESLIRQFTLGIKFNRRHFPDLQFRSYSVEEPCFTSALPAILTSLGFKYASLKCPNTCWGGYTREYGNGIVNWMGPDGSSILTVPRYECEALQAKSQWQTIAWANSNEYLEACRKAGIKNPVGMCYQDAGWKNGPWIGYGERIKNNSKYITWTEYFEEVSEGKSEDNYYFHQEDMQVALMWGSQVMQRIGRQVRFTENYLVKAEKIMTMANIAEGFSIPIADLDAGWRTLLLAQHHDSWIVPYNGLRKGVTWADEIKTWTDASNEVADDIIARSDNALSHPVTSTDALGFIRVYNTLSERRKEVYSYILPNELKGKDIIVYNAKGKKVDSFIEKKDNLTFLTFDVDVPSFGYTTYKLKEERTKLSKSKGIIIAPNGDCVMENDMYRISFDAQHGGKIKSLIAKKLGNKDFVDAKSEFGFNEVKGYFYEKERFISNAESQASFYIEEDNELRKVLRIESMIEDHPCTQRIILNKAQEAIDFSINIDWQRNEGIGEPRKKIKDDDLKDYHDTRYMLNIFFPTDFSKAKIYKNAPFDVCESRLDNTFFQRWSGIKHNIILNWVDLLQNDEKYGLALFSDHTTTYSHGQDYPLALTAQYSGGGLWGRNYGITQATTINYALVPHVGKWDESGLWTKSNSWNEGLMATFHKAVNVDECSFIQFNKSGYELTSSYLDEDKNLVVRVYNAESDDRPLIINFGFEIKQIEEIELDGRVLSSSNPAKAEIQIAMPRFAFKTYRIKR